MKRITSTPRTSQRFANWTRWVIPANILLVAAALFAADPVTIDIQSKTLFPESITSTKDGAIYVGSSAEGAVYRIPPGKTEPEIFIKPGTGGLSLTVLGVLADEKSNTLWVCSQASMPATLMSFDLKSGAHKASYPLPGEKPACNDAAVRNDGTVYVAETAGGAVVMLKKGATTAEVAIKDPLLAGADGIAFLQDQNVLYVNSVSDSKLLRVTLGKDGKGTGVTELKLSKPIQGPDGMRTLDGKRLLLAENRGGKMDIVSFPKEGEATIETIKEGLAGTPAVTYARGMAWIIEGKFNLRTKAEDPSPFKLYGVPVSAK